MRAETKERWKGEGRGERGVMREEREVGRGKREKEKREREGEDGVEERGSAGGKREEWRFWVYGLGCRVRERRFRFRI